MAASLFAPLDKKAALLAFLIVSVLLVVTHRDQHR